MLAFQNFSCIIGDRFFKPIFDLGSVVNPDPYVFLTPGFGSDNYFSGSFHH
jgi:hypothetical protein